MPARLQYDWRITLLPSRGLFRKKWMKKLIATRH